MERVLKENSSRQSANTRRVTQGKSAQADLSSYMNNSPMMIAQRKKLQSLFGGAAQLQGAEEEMLQGKFETAQRVEDEEMLQGKFEAAQRVEDEEMLQGKFETAQRVEDEEMLQGKFETVQRVEDEEPLQGKFETQASVQLKEEPAAKSNNTGLPDKLKSGIENLSGMSMDNVKVHYNSSQPAQLNALAYAQGSDIHVAPGQEQHLPHEAWHVVQQAQGRVQPTMQMKDGVPVNDDVGLEREADVMGGKAVQMFASYPDKSNQKQSEKRESCASSTSIYVTQRMIGLSIDDDNIIYTTQDAKRPVGLKGHQGDHTTPFTSLQDQVANAIEGVTLDHAWVNLYDTLTLYTTLPGWKLSTKWVQDTVRPYVANLLTTKGDINALQEAVSQLLSLRNQIALTSLPKGGHGNGEGKWAGSLQYQERQFQLGNTPKLNKNEVLEYIWKAFDHGRVKKLGEDNRTRILEQHAITMADAYPQLNASLGIAAQDVADYYPKKDWVNYSPK